MSRPTPLFAVVATIGLLGLACTGFAQENEEDSSGDSLWNAEQLMDQVCDGIARKYNLTDQQKAYTRKLMAHHVKAFLDRHQRKVRTLVAEAIRLAAPGAKRNPDDFQEWAQRSRPLWDEAKEAILKGNERWRRCLNEDQKKIHDRDLRLMRSNFEAFDKKFARWRDGGYDPGIDRFVFRTRSAPEPPEGQDAVVGPGPWTVTNDSYWDLYVRNFIKRYKLDAAQAETAYSILKECKDRAEQYTETHKGEIDTSEAKLRELRLSGSPRRDIIEAEKQHRGLTAPLDDLFTELRERLEKIPTSAQRELYEGEKLKQRERIRQAYEERRKTVQERAKQAESRPSSAPAEIATTRPVKGPE